MKLLMNNKYACILLLMQYLSPWKWTKTLNREVTLQICTNCFIYLAAHLPYKVYIDPYGRNNPSLKNCLLYFVSESLRRKKKNSVGKKKKEYFFFHCFILFRV